MTLSDVSDEPLAVPVDEGLRDVAAISASAAQPRAITNKWTGITSITGYDYVMDRDKMIWSNMQMTATSRGWHLYRDPNSGIRYLQWDYPSGYRGHEPYSGSIVLRFPKAAYDGAGNRYDIVMTVTNLWVNAPTTVYVHRIFEFYDISATHPSRIWAHGSPGTWMNVNYQVMAPGTNTAQDGNLLLSFADLDQPGIDGSGNRSYADINNYTESVRLNSGVMSPVYMESNSVLKVSGDKTTYSATRNTDTAEEKRSGISFLGNAKGTSVTFAICYAGTSVIPTTMDSFQKYTATTYARYQQKDGSWGSYGVVNQKTVTSGMSYKYTWTHDGVGVSSAVYGTPSNATVGVDAMKSDVTYYIDVPRKQYTYTFNANKPNGEAVSNMPSNVTKYAQNTVEPLKSPTSANYHFNGWNTKADGSGTWYKSNEEMLSSRMYYAQWTPKTYTLTYDKNSPDTASVGDSNVSLSKSSQTAKYLSKWGELATASKQGYIFGGWWTKPSGGERITKDTVVRGSITAYAHWTPVTYTVNFHPNAENGAGTVTGTMSSVKLTYDKVATLPANAYRKTVKAPAEDDGGSIVEVPSVFKGWNRNAKSLDIGYADKAKVMNLTDKNGGVIDLYAIWDDTPNFEFAEYPDRYFTLDEAKSGAITEGALLETVKVYDRENRELPKKMSVDVANGDDFGVTVVGYDKDEWTSLTDDATVSVRYQVKDDEGTTTYLNIVVTVTRNGALPREEVEYYRAISDDYRGGLADASRWKSDELYTDRLDDALSGSAKDYALEVSGEELSGIRDYVASDGFGNSSGDGVLQRLFDMLFK